MNKFKWGCVAVVIANLCATIEGVEMKRSVIENLKCIQEAITRGVVYNFLKNLEVIDLENIRLNRIIN